MELKELTKKEFDLYALSHPLGNFQQTSSWGRFCEGEGFHAYYVGLIDKNDIVAASLLLSMDINKVKGRIFYAPHGFLIDYKNNNLLNTFTLQVTKFIENKNGFFLKIDPYVLLQDRDSNGNIIEGGINNSYIIDNLINNGFIKDQKDLIQPKFISRINLKNKSLDEAFNEFTSKSRQIVRRNQRYGFKIEQLDFDNLDFFFDIININSKKYKTVGYTKSYFNDLINSFGKDNIKFMSVYFERMDVINNLNEEIKNILADKEERINNYHNSKMSEEYFVEKEMTDQKEIDRLNNLISYFYSLNINKVLMGAYLFIESGNEIAMLQGGMVDDYLKFDASYTLIYEMIKYAIDNDYKYFNLQDVGDITNSNNSFNSSFNYKKNFGGEVVEFIGEFNLPIKKDKFDLSLKNFPEYLGVKTIFIR